MHVNKSDFIVIVHDLRSVHNVASIFRTADAVGVDKIYLTGTSPAPKDRFGRWRRDFAKVSLGAERSVAFEQGEIDAVISQLKSAGYHIFALEQNKNSINYKTAPKHRKFALIVGNEPDGIDGQTLGLADTILEIPMCGEKESLNVSVAFAVAAYSLAGL